MAISEIFFSVAPKYYGFAYSFPVFKVSMYDKNYYLFIIFFFAVNLPEMFSTCDLVYNKSTSVLRSSL